MAKLNHIVNHSPAMVDVSGKEATRRVAVAEAIIRLPAIVVDAFKDGELITAKGPVFHTAIIAGTQAAKKTAELIPFCHPFADRALPPHPDARWQPHHRAVRSGDHRQDRRRDGSTDRRQHRGADILRHDQSIEP